MFDCCIFSTEGKKTLCQRLKILEQVGHSVACKNDNSACLQFLIMSPDPYFTSFLACFSVTFEIFITYP